MKKKKTVSSTSSIKWTKEIDKGGRWTNDYGTTSYSYNIGRYRLYIYRSNRLDTYHGKNNQWNWTIRDTQGWFNLMMPGIGGSYKTLSHCKKRTMLAFIFLLTLRLIKNSNHYSKLYNGGKVWCV